MHITANQIGFYDRANQPIDQPTYNPPYDAPCPYCGLPITPTDVRTHSIMYTDGIQATAAGEIVGVEKRGARCYFYRTHRTCDEAAAYGEMCALDDMAFAAVEAMPPEAGGLERGDRVAYIRERSPDYPPYAYTGVIVNLHDEDTTAHVLFDDGQELQVDLCDLARFEAREEGSDE